MGLDINLNTSKIDISEEDGLNVDLYNDNIDISDDETDDIIIEITGLKSISKFIGLEDTPLYYDNGKFFKVENNKIVYTDIQWKDISGNLEDAPEIVAFIKKLVEEISTKIVDNHIYLHNIAEDAHPYIQNIIQENYVTLDTKIDNTKEELSQDISNLNDALNQEISDRETADNALSEDIQEEILARIEGDTTLQNGIDTLNTNLQNEIDARIEGDTSLSNSLDELSNNLIQEVLDRQEQDGILQEQITSNYNTLDDKIDTEISNRTSADTTLQNNIDAEASARQNADSTLQGNIDTLSDTVSSNYNDLSNQIDNLSNTVSDNYTDLDDKISDLTNTVNDNDTAINNKVDGINTTLTTSINNLSNTVSSNYTTLDTKIDNTKTSLEGDISDLSNTVSQNYTDLSNAITTSASTINSRIDSEVSTLNTAIGTEATNRQSADNNLQSQIDAIVSSSDVFDIVGTYAELQAYDISTVPTNDIVKVLVDSSHDNAATYYRCVETTGMKSWSYIGSEGAYYTKSESDTKFVTKTTTINNKPLSSNITLTASDVNALPDTTVIGEGVLTLQKNGVNIDTFNANAIANKSINITVPTDTADLTNGAGFITASSLPTVNDGTLTIQANGITIGTFTANQSGNTTANIIIPDSATWGNISGTLSNQTDLQNALDAKYDASNPNGYTSNIGTVTSVNNILPSSNGNVSIPISGAPTWGEITGDISDQTDLQDALDAKANSADLAIVATSGSYNDLSDKPTIPSEVTESTVSGWGFTKNVGTVTSVNNVSPVNGNVSITIPTVNNATLTIQKNGTTVKTFTANASTDVTANITVPTKISDLTDDTTTYPINKANTLTGLTSTISELNILDGATLSTTELNYVDGVTSAIQTQLDNKLAKKPDGTNNLIDSGNKINTTYIPDVILGQMLYAGTFVPSTAVATLSTNAKTKLGTTSNTITLTNNTTAITGYKANEGCYYICSADGSFASISFLTGDWLVSTGSAWQKIDNTDAVTGVKGNAEGSYRTGNVNITADNVLPAQSSNSGKFLTTNGSTASWGTAATASNTMTFTNKTFDANGTGNSISNLETADFATGVIQTTVRATASASNTALASEKAIATALDGKQASGNYVTTDTAQTISAVKTFSSEPVINTNIQFGNVDSGTRGIWGKVGTNDYWRVEGGATAANAGYMELATADDGNEPIYIRQYTGQFSTLKRTATILDASGNTTFPGSVTATSFVGNASSATKLGTSTIGGTTTPIYLNGGTPTALSYTIAKSVPSDAVFTDTKNTAGSTDTSSKIFLVGATSQATNPQTYSQDTVFVDTDGALNSVTPTAGNSSTKVATTAFVGTALGNYLLKSGGTMTGALNFANNTWNNVGDDAAIGDCNVGGHIGVKQLNGSSCGFQFYNSSGTALSQLNAISGGVTSSGSVGLSNSAAKMQYNSTTEAIEFVFA